MQAGILGYFGDKRRAAAGSRLVERVMETGSLVVRKFGKTRAGEMSFHRFLSAPSVATTEMVETLAARTTAACQGRHIIAVQDTTEINFAGREERRRGLGPAGDGVSAGFFLHPVVAVDRETGDVLGLLGAKLWTRSDEYVETAGRARPLADKESVRWLEGADCAAACLAGAASVTVVADREGDIYAAFARRPPGVDLLVRAAQDRTLADGSRLFAAPASWPELRRITVQVPPSGSGKGARLATVALRAGEVVIARPAQGSDPADPPQITLHMVEAREVSDSGDEPPLLWRLLSSRPVDTAAKAEETVQAYKLRWRIEEIFRALKKDGMRLEETQVEKAEALFKLAMVGLAAATRTLPTGQRPRRQHAARHRRHRCRSDARGRSHRRNARRQDRASEEPASPRFAGLAGLGDRLPRRLELLLQTAGTEDHAPGLGGIRRHGRRVPHRDLTVKSVNPSGLAHGPRR